MGKSRKRLAILLAAVMAISMMTGFTSFAAEGDDPAEVTVISATIPEQAGGDMPEPEKKKVDTPESEEKKVDTPESEEKKVDTPESEEKKVDTPESEEKKVDTPESEEKKVDTPESEEKKVDTTEPDSEKPDLTEAAALTQGMSLQANAPVLFNTVEDDTAESEEADTTEEAEAAESEESDTAVFIGDKLIEEKDEFVSLGVDKGEYKYYDGTLVLKNVVIEIDPEYGGAAITVVGTLVIDLEGDNYLTTTGNPVLAAYLYDYTGTDKENTLTITGDGSLTISNKGNGKIDEDTYYGDGVFVNGGDLVIDGAELTSDIYNSGACAAIWVQEGDVVITNGADVTAKSTAVEDVMDHYGIYAGGGKISVTNNSDVYASADGDISDLAKLVAAVYDPAEYKDFWGTEMWSSKICDCMLYANYLGLVKDAKAQLGIGMHSDGTFYPELLKDYSGGIFIDDSNVRSIGSFASMLVKGLNATIKINDSTIVSPDGVNVRELMAVIGDDPDAAAEIIGAILAKGEGPVDMDAIMEKVDKLAEEGKKDELEEYLTSLFEAIGKDVNIVRDAELQAQKAGLGIPTTGDNFRAEGLVIAMIAAGVVIAYCIRRKVSA